MRTIDVVERDGVLSVVNSLRRGVHEGLLRFAAIPCGLLIALLLGCDSGVSARLEPDVHCVGKCRCNWPLSPETCDFAASEAVQWNLTLGSSPLDEVPFALVGHSTGWVAAACVSTPAGIELRTYSGTQWDSRATTVERQ